MNAVGGDQLADRAKSVDFAFERRRQFRWRMHPQPAVGQLHDRHARGEGEFHAQVAEPDHRPVDDPHAVRHGFQDAGRLVRLDGCHAPW